MELIVATSNIHKLDELSRLITSATLKLPSSLNISYDFEENGETFTENALGKALALFELTGGIPVIADDSGLAVAALKGGPGVRTARYGSEVFGRLLEAKERNSYLLENIKAVPADKRQASFICAIALVLAPNRYYLVQESVDGFIAQASSGDHGFGYDPVFYLPEYGKTMAQLDDAQKDSISHRGRAARAIDAIIRKII